MQGMTVLNSENWGLTPAMETGLFQRPQDRVFIIELENSIVSFINSNTESFQLRPMNSYYRLLSHQIAEYHNLNHVLARTQDSCVILFKGENFQKIEGKPLLQELQHSKLEESVSSNENVDRSNNNKTFRILKRKEVCNDNDSKRDNNIATSDKLANPVRGQKVENDDKSSTDLEQERIEKERLYEQRKQEIFDKLNKNEDDGKSINSSSGNDSDNEWSDWLDSDDANTQTTNGTLSSPSPSSPYTTMEQNKPRQQFYDSRRGRGGRRRGAVNYKDTHRGQNRRNKENGSYQAGYATPYMVYPPTQIGNNALPTYPIVYNPASPAPSSTSPVLMGGNTVFMNPYIYNMNPQGSCPFGAPMPMYQSYQYQYQYPYNPQYQNGLYSNTPGYNPNGYKRSSGNKYNQSQRKDPPSNEGPEHNKHNNTEKVRSGNSKDTPSSEDASLIEVKFDKLSIFSEK